MMNKTRAMRRWLLGSALVITGCGLLGGGSGLPEADPDVVAFARRIDGFYRLLENRPLDVQATFENPEIRGYFGSDDDFQTYYALLAAQIRRGLFRNSKVARAEIVEFRFPETDLAVVQVRLSGPHERSLRIGGAEAMREDTWARVSGRWVVSPGKL